MLEDEQPQAATAIGQRAAEEPVDYAAADYDRPDHRGDGQPNDDLPRNRSQGR
jgi:hypothetical protein